MFLSYLRFSEKNKNISVEMFFLLCTEWELMLRLEFNRRIDCCNDITCGYECSQCRPTVLTMVRMLVLIVVILKNILSAVATSFKYFTELFVARGQCS